MNGIDELEKKINEEIGLVGRFAHPMVGEELAQRIVRSMVKERRRGGMIRFVFGIGMVGAAAGLILAVSLFVGGNIDGTNGSGKAEITSIWTLGMEDGVKAVFADLDFEAGTTQPVMIQENAKTVDEMDEYVWEAVNGKK
ncbi:MAG: hypothetical protein WC975_16430 [Phycisphaerae bacterium]